LTDTETPSLPSSQAFARQMETVVSPDDLMQRRYGVVIVVLSTLVAIPALVCILVDWLYGGGGWSRFVVASLVLVWWLGFTPRLFFRKSLVICLSDVGLIGLFLFAVDIMGPWRGWSLNPGLPIILATALFVVMVWLALRLYHTQTGFVLATVFGAAVALCLVVDASVSYFLTGRLSVLWSLITMAAGIPLTIVSVIMQLVFFRSSRFQRYLHW
jgi:hypothetical protein